MKLILYSIVVTLSICSQKTNSQVFNGTCDIVDVTTKPAYTNWPYSINCDRLKTIWEARPDSTDGDTAICEVTQEDKVINNTVIKSTTVGNISYLAKYIVNKTLCISSKIRVDLQPFPEGTCNEVVAEDKKNNDVNFIESTMGDSVKLYCRPPQGSPDIIPAGANPSKFRTKWWVDCKNMGYRYNNLWSEFSDPGYPNGLNMPRVDFYDAADFTCTVTYEGRTLYAVTHSQCIKQRTNSVNPTITCTNEVTEALGESAELDCTGQIVFGVTSSEDFIIEWKRNDEVICENHFFNRTSQGIYGDRHSCIVQGNNDSVVCVVNGEATPSDQIQRERKPIELKMHIKNLDDYDYGKYTASIKYKSSGVWKSDDWEIALHEDNTPRLLKLIMILSVCLGVLIFIIVLVLLFKKFEIYILVAYKRSWLWKWDRDDKQYVCYLSYLYDTETMSDTSLKATSSIVFAIQNLMEDSNYNYYDEQRQIDFTTKVEKITNLIERCHRMIFVLTPEYLDNRWMRFHAELGFHGLLESKMGLIFVLTPGTMKLLKKLAKSDKVWNRLLIAVKANRSIKWKKDMNEDKLKKYIEYRLPKLARKVRTLVDSESGSVEGLNHEYVRSISQSTTQTTVFDDDVDPQV